LNRGDVATIDEAYWDRAVRLCHSTGWPQVVTGPGLPQTRTCSY